MNRLFFMGILSVIGCATAACSLSPMPNCKEGTVICESSNDGNGGALFRCIDDEKVYERNCMLGCNGDACATNDACTVGSTQCVDEHKIKQCGPNGWEFFECNGTCANGQCTIQDCNDTESTCEDGFTAKHCQNGKSLLEECPTGQKCDNGACVAIPTPAQVNQEICDDNIDNDNNGKTDCEDEICKMHTHCSTIKPSNEICDNHIDDDGNGKADCQDEACSTHSNCSTTSSDKEICNNNIDDDGNGKADCQDEACKSQEHCSTATPVQEICDNNIDDNGNGKADCDDEACKDKEECKTTTTVCNAECTHCKMDGSVFYICSAKGIPEYQKLSDEERSKFNKLVFVGNINLDDAQQTVKTAAGCEWKNWEPLVIPTGMTISGKDAIIQYITKNAIRCTLPKALFDKVEIGAITNLNLDYDFLGEGPGILVNSLTNSSIEKLTYKGKAVQIGKDDGESTFSFVSIANDYKIIDTTIEYEEMIGTARLMGALIANATNGNINNVNISTGLLRNICYNCQTSGLVGELHKKHTIKKVSLKAKEVIIQTYDWFFGGLAQTATGDLIIDDVYFNFNSLKQTTGNRNYSGGLIGYFGNESTINISKAVIILSKFSGLGMSLSGLIGYTYCPHLSVNNSIIISDDPLYGIIGSLSSKPKLNNIVILSPQNKCENILIDKIDTNDFTLVCSPEDNIFYYTETRCKTGKCGEPYLQNADEVLNRLQEASNIEWKLQTVHVGGNELTAPVFDTLGPLP